MEDKIKEEENKNEILAFILSHFDGQLHGLNIESGDIRTTHYPLITLSFIQQWLREVHKIVVLVGIYYDGTYYFSLHCYWDKTGNWTLVNGRSEPCNTYEQALEKGIFEALKLIK